MDGLETFRQKFRPQSPPGRTEYKVQLFADSRQSVRSSCYVAARIADFEPHLWPIAAQLTSVTEVGEGRTQMWLDGSVGSAHVASCMWSRETQEWDAESQSIKKPISQKVHQ